MNSPATFPSTRPPKTDSIDFLLETVLQSLGTVQATLAGHGAEPGQPAPRLPDSGAEYDFRYLREFCG